MRVPNLCGYRDGQVIIAVLYTLSRFEVHENALLPRAAAFTCTGTTTTSDPTSPS